MELDALTAFSMPGAVLVGTAAILFDVCHDLWIAMGGYNQCAENDRTGPKAGNDFSRTFRRLL